VTKTKAARPPGEPAESRVAKVLEAAGWTILARRMRLGSLEIDLLASRGDVAAIVEVRGRRAGGWVSAFDSISPTKRARLVRAAKRLWSSRLSKDASIRVLRIDVASVTYDEQGTRIEIAEGAIAIE
jgi:putative endonuclease